MSMLDSRYDIIEIKPTNGKQLNLTGYDGIKYSSAGYNLLIIAKGNKFNNVYLIYRGSNSIISILETKGRLSFSILIGNNSLVYMGKSLTINNFNKQKLFIMAYEQCNVIIGNDCMFSFNVFIRTSDVHLIYDSLSNLRISKSASVFIGDHVWIGQNCMILKNSSIGSGAVLGASSVVSAKKVDSNSIWAGNPARSIKQNIFWIRTSSVNFTNTEIEKFNKLETDKYKYVADCDYENYFITLDKHLKDINNMEDKVLFIDQNLINNVSKNRFALRTSFGNLAK